VQVSVRITELTSDNTRLAIVNITNDVEKKILHAPILITASTDPPLMSGGLNRSMQHWLAVYSPEFQSPRFFAGVD
jgi:hypothetical protein